MLFDPLAVTGFLDVHDIPDFFNEKRNILASTRLAIKGRKRNRYRHLVLQYFVPRVADCPECDSSAAKILREINAAMAVLINQGYAVDDERYAGSDKYRSWDTHRWTIIWKEE